VESPRHGPYRGKRLVDLALLAVVAVPAGLVGAVCALAVRLTSPGPVLFRQRRVGRDEVTFDVLKFRSMLAGDNPLVPAPDRITPVGRWLRRFSLDELPQLLNVAKGEMSVVGPRPFLPAQAERCSAHQRGRFAVRPGLTGWAQVNGRNAIRWAERMELDVEYVQRQSLRFDLRILAATARVVLTGAGADGHDPDDPFVLDGSTGTGGEQPGPSA
jgi:lipopolysaccharide/colanic/teichoic acid biosynthesis glycosyltransferase